MLAESIRMLNSMMEMDIQYLWYVQKVEEDVVRVIVETGFELL